MHRDLEELLSSQAKMLELRGQAPETDSYRMRKVFEEHLRTTRVLLASRPCYQVLDVSYNKLVREPLADARRVSTFVGRRLDVERMAMAVDSKRYRNKRLTSDRVLPPCVD